MFNKEHIFAQMLLRSWPFPRGAGRLTDKFFRKLHFRNNVQTVRTTDGFAINVMPNDLIGRHIYLTGEFDRSTVEILTAFAEPGDMLLDVGANIGYVSACFLTLIPGSKAIAIEPQPDVLDLLRQNLRPFGDTAIVCPYALSDHDGEAFLQIDYENRGASKLAAGGVKVSLRTADSLFAEASITDLDIVKIDVEGHEEEVIRSSANLFERMQPKVIMFEEHGDKSAGSIGDIFKRIGFDVFSIRKRLATLHLSPVTSTRDCVSNDYLAVSRTRNIPKRARELYGI
jgi:FkbM family methyltransferase